MVACFNNLKDKESIERKMDKKTFSAFFPAFEQQSDRKGIFQTQVCHKLPGISCINYALFPLVS